MHFLFTFINKSCIMYKLNSKGGTISLPKRWHHARQKEILYDYGNCLRIGQAAHRQHIRNRFFRPYRKSEAHGRLRRVFQTGSDEHGEKIELKAQAAGLTPKQYVDQRVADIKRIWDLMDTTYDKFIRTTDAVHEEQVQKYLKSSINKAIYTKARTRAGIALRANLSGRRANLSTANAPTAEAKSKWQRRRHTSSI